MPKEPKEPRKPRGPREPKPTSMIIPVVGIIVVPLVFLGGYTLLKQGSKSEVSGTIRLGLDETMAVDRCESGVLGKDAAPSRPQWRGVDLFAAAAPARRVRIIDDAEKGKLVTLRRGDEAPEGVDRAACKRFEIQVRETGAKVFDHHGMEGSIDLDCPAIVAKIAFASCYDGS